MREREREREREDLDVQMNEVRRDFIGSGYMPYVSGLCEWTM